MAVKSMSERSSSFLAAREPKMYSLEMDGFSVRIFRTSSSGIWLSFIDSLDNSHIRDFESVFKYRRRLYYLTAITPKIDLVTTEFIHYLTIYHCCAKIYR